MADTRFKKGQVPWNRKERIKKECRTCGKSFEVKPSLMRVMSCSRSCAKKGTVQSEETKLKRRNNMKGILTHSIISRGEDRPQWKGDRVSYRCLHRWVEVYKGRPRECECCHTHEGNRFHWANISGTYKRNLNDWIRLCPKCHKGYDLGRITLSV